MATFCALQQPSLHNVASASADSQGRNARTGKQVTSKRAHTELALRCANLADGLGNFRPRRGLIVGRAEHLRALSAIWHALCTTASRCILAITTTHEFAKALPN